MTKRNKKGKSRREMMNTRMVVYGYDLPHGSMVLYKVPTLLLGMVMLTKLVLT